MPRRAICSASAGESAMAAGTLREAGTGPPDADGSCDAESGACPTTSEAAGRVEDEIDSRASGGERNIVVDVEDSPALAASVSRTWAMSAVSSPGAPRTDVAAGASS